MGGQPVSAQTLHCQCSDHTLYTVSAQTIHCTLSVLRPYTASNWSACLSSQKEASSIDDAQESPQTVC